MKKRVAAIVVVILILLSAGVSFVYWNSTTVSVPKRISDNAAIFTEEEKGHIESYHQMMLDWHDIDYRVVTTRETLDIDTYAARQFKQQLVGSDSATSRGLLLVIDMAQDQVRLEVSANLESVFTDAFIAYIEKRQMVPFFNLGRVTDGILATGELLNTRAEDAKNGKEFDPTVFAGSMGGGASSEAGIGKGRDTTFANSKADVLAADTPEKTLERYFTALGVRNGRSDLDVFTPETRKFMASLVRTAAQMDNTRRYKKCELDRVVYSADGRRAVLLHKLSNRSCDPFTFEHGQDGKWRLDLKAIGNGLGHSYGNIWYLHRGRIEKSGIWKYYFGFKDYIFYRSEGEQFDHQTIPYYQLWGIQMNHVTLGAVMLKIYGKDSFIAKSGIQKGDIILRWEEFDFPNSGYIETRMKKVREGLDVDILFRRGDQTHHMIVKAPPKPSLPGQLRWGATYRSTGSIVPVVHHVTPGSVGDKLGLKTGDRITEWNGVKRPSNLVIYKMMRNAKPGDPITVEVNRYGEKVLLNAYAEALRVMGEVR